MTHLSAEIAHKIPHMEYPGHLHEKSVRNENNRLDDRRPRRRRRPRAKMAFRSLFLSFLCSTAAVNAITVYNQLPLAAQSTSTAPTVTDPAAAAGATPTANYSGLAAYDPTTWPAPAIPQPPPPTQLTMNLMPTADLVGGLSIKTPSSFFGLSIEMSVVTQICQYPPSPLFVSH